MIYRAEHNSDPVHMRCVDDLLFRSRPSQLCSGPSCTASTPTSCVVLCIGSADGAVAAGDGEHTIDLDSGATSLRNRCRCTLGTHQGPDVTLGLSSSPGQHMNWATTYVDSACACVGHLHTKASFAALTFTDTTFRELVQKTRPC